MMFGSATATADGPGTHRCGGATPVIPGGIFGRPGETVRSPLMDAGAAAHPLSDAAADSPGMTSHDFA